MSCSGPLFEHLCPRDKIALGLTSVTWLHSFEQCARRKLYHKSMPDKSNCVRRIVVKNWTPMGWEPKHNFQQITHLHWRPQPTLFPTHAFSSWPNLDQLIEMRAVVKYGVMSLELPPNLQKLHIQSDGRLTIMLPNSLLILRVSKCLVFGLANHPNLTSLKYFAHQTIVEDFCMPPNLTVLRLPPTHQLGDFPQSLKVLKFDQKYNFPVKSLPPMLQSWDCGMSWNHVMPNLPPSLTSLFLGPYFDHKIAPFPKSIKSLTLGDTSANDFFHLLHSHDYPHLSLFHLFEDVVISEETAILLAKQLPKLEFLLCRDFSNNLTKLRLRNLFLHHTNLQRVMDLTPFYQLRSLIIVFGMRLDHECDIVMPVSLEKLRIRHLNRRTHVSMVTLHLNQNLKSLFLASTDPIFVIDKFPRLKNLEMDGNAVDAFPLPLPDSLKKLRIVNTDQFNQDFGVLPPNLEVVDVPNSAKN